MEVDKTEEVSERQCPLCGKAMPRSHRVPRWMREVYMVIRLCGEKHICTDCWDETLAKLNKSELIRLIEIQDRANRKLRKKVKDAETQITIGDQFDPNGMAEILKKVQFPTPNPWTGTPSGITWVGTGIDEQRGLQGLTIPVQGEGGSYTVNCVNSSTLSSSDWGGIEEAMEHNFQCGQAAVVRNLACVQ